MSVAAPLALRVGDEPRLTAMARSQTITAAAAQRARIVLLAAEGVPNAEIARRVGVSRPTVVAGGSVMPRRGSRAWPIWTGPVGRR
jgi:DNA-binding NarL/FixJ family response regulator